MIQNPDVIKGKVNKFNAQKFKKFATYITYKKQTFL